MRRNLVHATSDPPSAWLDPPAAKRRVTVYAGTDVLTGKMRQLRETAPTHAEAKKILTKLQRQVDEDQHPKSDITVRQAIEQWLAVVELEQTTRERYDDLIRLYILPTFGNLPAAKLDLSSWSASTPACIAAVRCATASPERATPADRSRPAPPASQQIRSGELEPGDQLPTLAELAVANTVAVGTAHRALTLLRNEGLVEVTRGRRAVVAARAASAVSSNSA
jgi:Bacterial regulatory proteins, gntR family